MKKLSLLVVMVFCVVGLAMAQRTVTGTLSDDSGEPLIGANILVKGTSVGTVTDFDGKYSIEMPDGSSVLVFSYTGYTTKEVEVGASNVMDVVMSEGVELGEVVVTGLGIKKEKKALGYAVTTVGAGDIELRPEADVARVLRGKVAGVDINQTSGLAGSGTNVIIRGYSSITGTNQPLFVVDGVPFNSDTNTDRSFTSGGTSASSRFLDIDPNNIAEVSVLKGLSATVLYGEAGRNGVILVTTKNGTAADLNKKFEISVNQSLFANNIASLPEDQDSYGNGFHNGASAAFSNWGAPFDQPNKNNLVDGTIRHYYDRAALANVFPQYQGARYEYRAYDNLEPFFSTGLINNTSISMSTRLEKETSINFTYSYRDEEGFVDNSNFGKHNFGLGVNTRLANGIKLNSSFNYMSSDRVAPPSGVSFSSNPTFASLFSNIFYTPRSVDLHGLEWEDPVTGGSVYYRANNGIQHPIWTLNNTGDTEKVRRFFGNVAVSYDITNDFTLQYRLGIDNYDQGQRLHINKGGIQQPDGVLNTSDRQNTILDHTLNLIYDKDLNEDLNLSGTVGFNMRRDVRNTTRTNSTEQFVFGILQHDNYINHLNSTFFSEENLLGAFATASLGYKNYLYFNVQARNDWTSTLEEANRSVLYPSVSMSFIPTEAIASLQQSTTVNYLKFRVGYGTSAGYPNPYQTRNVLGSTTRDFITSSNQTINTNEVTDRFGNPNLEPEIHREFEVGLDGRFFNNRVGLDFSYYNKQSSDLIIDLDLDPSTGFTNTTINSAELSNEGVEIGLTITPVRTQKFEWTLNGNFTKNVNVIESLADGLAQFPISGYTTLGNFAIPGQPYGIIQGEKILRDDNGNAIISSAGLFQVAPEIGILGDPNPNFQLNGGTTLTFGGLSMNVLFSYVDGGVIYATTPSTLMGRGILQETDFDRFVPVIQPGVKADGTPNDIQITSTQHYWRNGGVFNDEMRVYDGTYLKLREVSISYSLPASVLANSPFGSVTLSASGQNLWYDAFGFPDGANFDPEVLSLGVGNGRGFELMNVPTARQIGGSLKVTF